jgi:hypothetical protein
MLGPDEPRRDGEDRIDNVQIREDFREIFLWRDVAVEE